MTEDQINSLENKIAAAIIVIKEGKQTPKETGIANLLLELKKIDEPAYLAKLEEYKPISKAYFDSINSTDEAKAKKAKRIEEEFIKINSRLSAGSGNLSDADVLSPSKNSGRPEKPFQPKQQKIRTPKSNTPVRDKGDRDRKGFTFEKESYGKGPLVLAVLKKHVSDNPQSTIESLKKTFPDTLLKGYGIFQTFEKAMEISKDRKRFFLKDTQLIRIKSGNIAVCNQFSSDNILPFLDQAKKLGYEIS